MTTPTPTHVAGGNPSASYHQYPSYESPDPWAGQDKDWEDLHQDSTGHNPTVNVNAHVMGEDPWAEVRITSRNVFAPNVAAATSHPQPAYMDAAEPADPNPSASPRSPHGD